MRDQDFERIMDRWADHEVESAPEMHPTEAMYHMVQARKKRNRVSLLTVLLRPALLGAVATSLLLLAVASLVLFRARILLDLPPRQQVALVGQREGFASEKGTIISTPATSRGGEPKKDLVLFGQLVFQYQKQGSPLVEGIDLLAPPGEGISLTSADNYRLVLEPAKDCYAYVFQLTSSDVLVQLFPGEAYSPFRNPLRRGGSYALPSEPDWFYLDGGKGQERLYVVASLTPLQGLADLYSQYDRAGDESSKQEILSRLLEKLGTVRETHPGEAAGWVFVFDRG